jgi:hypothetical protein
MGLRGVVRCGYVQTTTATLRRCQDIDPDDRPGGN